MGLAMLLPALCDLYVGNNDWIIFLRSSSLTIMISILALFASRGVKWQFSTKFGFSLVIYLWFLAVFLGALPLYFSHLHISFAAAIFESCSAITTTGGTVLHGLDHMPPGVLLWRSLLCWVGGIGCIALALLLLPNLRVDGVKFFNMEAAYKAEKVLPRVKQIAQAIVFVYLALTVLCIFSYYLAGMSFFDAVNNSMTTIATAGLSTHDASFGFYHKKAILIVSCIFMLLSAMPFMLFVKILMLGFRKNIKDLQVIVFLIIVSFFTILLAYYLSHKFHMPASSALLNSAFHVISTISSTGYANQNYGNWGSFALGISLCLSLVGGCSGSTAGGIKVTRLIVFWRITRLNILCLISPHIMRKERYNGAIISEEMSQTVLLFLCLYMLLLFLGSVALLMTGLDLLSSFTGALSSLSNIGLAWGDRIGPLGDYASLSDTSLWILSFLMLAGRVEIIALFILFSPDFWRR